MPPPIRPVPVTPRIVSTASTVVSSGQPFRGSSSLAAELTKTRRRTRRPWLSSKASNTGRPPDPRRRGRDCLQPQEIVGPLGPNLCRDVLLAAHGVERHDATVEMQGVEQLRNGGDLVRLAVDLALTEHQSLITRPGADQMQRAVIVAAAA